jgi:hypothetical protein
MQALCEKKKSCPDSEGKSKAYRLQISISGLELLDYAVAKAFSLRF